jgi:hypothetical protein
MGNNDEKKKHSRRMVTIVWFVFLSILFFLSQNMMSMAFGLWWKKTVDALTRVWRMMI